MCQDRISMAPRISSASPASSLYPGIMAALKPWAPKFEGGLPGPAA